MCEATNPEENENNNVNEMDDEDEDVELEDDEDEELTSAELLALNHELDTLNLVIDEMESKRESIHTQLLELLQSTRDVRKEFQEQKEMSDSIKDIDLDSASKPKATE
ncbi:hypothetical protein RI129_005314 [Pyrocoelia pectoralis]|uniref:Uncharacterized protein n=1 Tax=Pyrocoelia pectoralis TaxID=417401 RepID=A0AAN7ZHF3_9COLE